MKYSFLLCSERSGSNLILRLLNSHPTVCGPSPNHTIRAFAQNELNYGDVANEDNWNLLLEDFSNYLNCQLGIWNSSFDESDHTLIPEKSIISLLKYRFEKEAKAVNKDSLFIKENKLYNYFPFIIEHFPKALFVYQTRDPRDMVLSWKKSPNHPGGVVRGTKQWIDDQMHFTNLLASEDISEEDYIRISYEDLVQDSESTLRSICDKMGIPFSDEILNFFKDENTIKNAKKIKNWDNLSKPVLKNNSRKFLKELTAEEISYIEYLTKDLMEELAYEAINPTISEDEFRRISTELESKEDDKQKITLTEEEETLRSKRMKVIQTIINRKLT